MRFRANVLAVIMILMATQVEAQLTTTRQMSGTTERTARFEEQLINGLRATRFEQQAFLRTVVQLTEQNRLSPRLVNAIYAWARNRQPLYPFPYFERGLRVEARKRNVSLPPVAVVIQGGQLKSAANLPNLR